MTLPIYTFPLFLTAAALLAAALYIAFNLRGPAVLPGVAGVVLVAVWAWMYGLELTGPSLSIRILWHNIRMTLMAFMVYSWLVTAICYTDHHGLSNGRFLTLAALPSVLTVILIWSNPYHHLFRANFHLETFDGLTALVWENGPGYWFYIGASYTLVFVYLFVLLRAGYMRRGFYRWQIVLILVATLLPLGMDVAFHLGWRVHPGYNVTPLTLWVSGGILSWALLRYQLFTIIPLAREKLLDHMQEAVLVLDASRYITDLNPAAARLFGLHPQKALGQPAEQWLAAWPSILEASVGGHATCSEMELRSAAGEALVVDLEILPLNAAGEQLGGRLLVLRDVTARWQAEQRLRQLSQAVEHSPASIVITDTEGKIQYVNPRFSVLTGYTLEEALGQNPRILKTEETSPEVHVQLWQTISAGQEWRGEFCNRKKNGEIYWESASISPILDASGRITHYVAVKEEITGRKRAESALQQYAAELQTRNDELDAFSHTVAHDLKNPVSTIVGFTNLLEHDLESLSPEQVRDALRKISQNSARLDRIIEELMLLSGVRKQEVTRQPLQMAAILGEAQDRLATLIEQSRGRIILPDVSAWPVALGHAPWVEEVWTNYLGNALKYGGASPLVEVSADWQEGGQVRFWVRDHGPGLTLEAQAKLFIPFSRLAQERASGHGLGLSIVRRIIKRLGGEVGVESIPGQGSAFFFTLPAAGDQQAPAPLREVEALETPPEEVVRLVFEAPSSAAGGALLTGQPAEWLTALRTAAQTGDWMQIHTLARQAQAQHPEIARLLMEIADRFEYGEILALVEQALE